MGERAASCIEKIKKENVVMAIIIRHNYNKAGISFFTPGEMSQQLAYMQHPAGHVIAAHVHNMVKREVHYTQEVLVIRKGRLRVDFYSDRQEYFESRILEAGDIILLSSGGHGFTVLDDVEMFEIKQGPYAGEGDKIRFLGVDDDKVVVK